MSRALPKPLQLFEHQQFDAIVTVCDRVRDACPPFSDDLEHVHWSLLDPATVQGTEDEQFQAFDQTALQLTMRIRALLPLLAQKKERLREQEHRS